MKPIKFILSLFFLAFFISTSMEIVTEHPFISLAITGAVLLMVKATYPIKQYNSVKFGVQVELWQNYIAENLFKTNPFFTYTRVADEFVLQGKVVHIPQAGSKPNVVKNRSSLPATVTQRTDTDVTYTLDEYSTDPVLITNADQVELSYSKMDSVLGDHRSALEETIGDNFLIKISPTAAASIVRTTGANYTSHITGTTGTRKGFTATDLKNAQVAMNKMKVPKDGRVAVMSEDMFSQLENSLTATQYKDFSRIEDAENGVIRRLYGFDIITRPDVSVYNAGATAVNAYGAAPAVTDNDAVLCWQKNYVERAKGEVKFFENLNDPTYFGDVYSGLMRFGGRKVYNNETGVVAIVQVA